MTWLGIEPRVNLAGVAGGRLAIIELLDVIGR